MENENNVNYPSTGASAGFAIGFLVFYIVVVFSMLGLFFKMPF